MDTATLDDLTEQLTMQMRANFHQHGMVHNIILGFDRSLHHQVSLAQGEAGGGFSSIPASADMPKAYIIPAPFRAHAARIKNIAENHQVVAFAMMSENWTYPDGDAGIAASQAFLAGNGPPPSEHPDRKETVTCYFTCPSVGYYRLSSWSIRRKNRSAPRLRPQYDSKTSQEADPAAIFALNSWLEECLPAPGF